MKRFIKVNNEWIDTQKNDNRYYYTHLVSIDDDTQVWCLDEQSGADNFVGILQDEKD